MTPLLSVVIPTFRRPSLLNRAIASALEAAPCGDVEVVVVPNGPDDSWKPVAQAYHTDKRVRWNSLKVGHAGVARNHGLSHARGKFVRFLDDDDYLYPAAARQLEKIELRCADLCSAPLENILRDGRKGGVFSLPNSNDYPTVALLSAGISLTQGSIFLRRAIQDLRWQENITLYDDYIWMLHLAESREVDWLRMETPVGAYVQHDHARLSRTRRSNRNSRPLVTAILSLYENLAATGRAYPERTQATATALLTHAHSAFPSNPFFLSRTIRHAQDIDPTARPTQSFFHDRPFLTQNLLATEWMMVAPRYITRSCRRLSWSLKDMLARARLQP